MRDRYDDDWNRRERARDNWRDRNERGPIERATDEVRSWFGDEGAQRRRRMMDGDRDWNDRADERGWRDRNWTDRNWNERSSINRAWNDRDYDRSWSNRDDRGQSWGAQGWSDSNYGYPGTYRPDWRGARYSRDWRDDREGRGWRGDYLGSYGSQDAPSRVGGYAGRGPKGYQRADTRIQEDVCDRLADAPEVDATDITITVSNGEVTLSGIVHDRWQKHRAEDIVEDISGVREVHNQLRVNRGDTSAATTTPTTATRR